MTRINLLFIIRALAAFPVVIQLRRFPAAAGGKKKKKKEETGEDALLSLFLSKHGFSASCAVGLKSGELFVGCLHLGEEVKTMPVGKK